jgi:ferritin
MLNKKIQSALNDQIALEVNSAYLYLSMAAFFEGENLSGFAHWMKLQYQEETGHAMKLFDYLNDRGGKVVLQAIGQPNSRFKSAREVFQSVLEHEREVSGSIGKLYELAVKEGDHATMVEMQWFIKEQVEEEKTAEKILEQLKVVGDHAVSLLMLDRQLAMRGS